MGTGPLKMMLLYSLAVDLELMKLDSIQHPQTKCDLASAAVRHLVIDSEVCCAVAGCSTPWSPLRHMMTPRCGRWAPVEQSDQIKRDDGSWCVKVID